MMVQPLSVHAPLCEGTTSFTGIEPFIYDDTTEMAHNKKLNEANYFRNDKYITTLHYTTLIYRPLFQDNLGKPVPERLNHSGYNEAREDGWQWHQVNQMQICTLLQKDNHTRISSLCFLWAGCSSCCSINSVKALKAEMTNTLIKHNF